MLNPTENKKSALAGVGRPMKCSFWRGSKLKRARRKAEAAAITNANQGTDEAGITSRQTRNNKKEGANPLVTKSAMESNSKPKAELVPVSRAVKPSIKSKPMPAKTSQKAVIYAPRKIKMMAAVPAKRLSKVKKLAKLRRTGIKFARYLHRQR